MKPEEVQKIVTDAVMAATKQFTNQLTAFSEQNKILLTKIETLEKGQIAGQDAQDRAQFQQYCDTPEMRKRLTPAAAVAAVSHMMTLRTAAPAQFEVGQGGKTEKSQVELYQESLKALPETVQLGEFATKDRAGQQETVHSTEFGGAVDEDRLKLHNDVLAYQQANPTASYETALVAVHNKKGGN